jgi:hypothetical protein
VVDKARALLLLVFVKEVEGNILAAEGILCFNLERRS